MYSVLPRPQLYDPTEVEPHTLSFNYVVNPPSGMPKRSVAEACSCRWRPDAFGFSAQYKSGALLDDGTDSFSHVFSTQPADGSNPLRTLGTHLDVIM